ncbi:PREDICTED: 25-hydroxyvitamin D-1 alpha hydroxylase, mitochondrial, partial [Chaetura pelagica]|uniref:25-hydroxyvitamin D-1 alpha hydroxylase, mitochondrial n=1 Tax=Chaetura pelagica TaxID=8897 RepID=UPI00052336CB
EGDEWQRLRRLLGRLLLSPGVASSFAGPVAAVVTDLLGRLPAQRQHHQHPQHLVQDLATEFCKFGLEGISSILFSSRLGCLEQEVPGDTETFLGAIRTVPVFLLPLPTMALPRPLLRLRPPPWRSFCQAWDYVFTFAKGHIDRRVAEVAARGDVAGDTCVTDQLAREKVPMEVIYGNVTELLLAGVDTISSTLSWSLYELARHPWVQDALHRQLVATVASGQPASALGSVPLLRAVVKETLRLYPVIPGNARVVPDRDIQVGEFLVPRETLITLCHYVTSRDSRYFPSPDSFMPERWLRGGTSPQGCPQGPPRGPPHPFASLPFGLGKRSCVGRRVAELELHQALAQILLHFEVRPEPGGSRVLPMTRTLLVPEATINLQFLTR